MNAELPAADIDRLDPTRSFEGYVDTYVEPPAPVVVNPRELPAEFYAARKRNEAGMWSRFIAGECPGKRDEQKVAAALSRQRFYQEKRAESFERCDTDGFLTQHFDGINADVARIAADIAERGGYALHLGLFDERTGARIPAVLVDGTDGPQWRLCDPATGRFLNEWVNDSRGPRGALAKRGWVVLGEWAKAEAKVIGEGRGLSGRAWAAAVRTDGGYPGRR